MSDAVQLGLFTDTPPPPPPSTLPDADARERIRTDLDANLLVEAGAGAGKTTEMVRRMVALVRGGRAEVSQIAAVTFTRKAAAELRERFQTALERELRSAVELKEHERAERIDRALREIDRAFLGTIHAFCARLLRERPLDAGIDPAFRETLGSEERRLRQRFWLTWLERLSAAGDPALAELRDVALRPQQLQKLFGELVDQPDVVYPLVRVPRPEAAFMRRRLEALMDQAQEIVPAREPAKGWDSLQRTLQRLRFHREVLGWSRDTAFLDVIGELRLGSFDVVQNRWADGKAAKDLSLELRALFGSGGAADALRRQWWAFRYPVALTFARRAARAYEQERVRAGTLNFQDLLMLAARLLRTSPAARRELGERYRYLLVDEFQDTDPIQAEVLFLLASDEELDLFTDAPDVDHVGEWLPPFASWRHLRPRPGALFVVGDPKQSIYRFRRADMTLYQQVKQRFASWQHSAGSSGAVLELVANFRSRRSIESLVNDIFRERFPEDETEVQARFAPMRVQPREREAVREGVFWYELDDPVHGRVDDLAAQDAARIAAWVDARIRSGERRPGDFLILTPNTGRLEMYASALESHDVPVQVTGAGVAEREELHELRLLLRALADPGDATLTVATLVGLFFGLDYEQLTEYALDRGGRFRFTDTVDGPTTPVERALAKLREFWESTLAEPADVAVARIVGKLGIVPLAAAGNLGASRAGALLFALDAIRAASLGGDASIAGAIAALDAALDEDESEAPLEPGRADVVRVMNLHKAKGLEAQVVMLAAPFGGNPWPPTKRVVRDETGRALGYTTVSDDDNMLAQPPDWEDVHAPIEQTFEAAEQDRLMYVAATRAAEELVIGCAYNARSPSKWRIFHEWIRQHGTQITLPEEPKPKRDRLERAPGEMEAEIAHADARRAAAKQPSYRLAAVTQRKAEASEYLAADEPAPVHDEANDVWRDGDGRGTEWGTAVHRAIEFAARGLDAARLRAVCRTLLTGSERPRADSGEPAELEELLQVVHSVTASPLWDRANAAAPMLLEVPFALRLSADEYARVIGRPAADPAAAPYEVLDGRIDLVFREDDGWVIVDFKSDAAGDRIPAELMRMYRAQLALYTDAWQRLSGEPVKEARLFFTAPGVLV
jgi:ATP-dependent helicase/nuclease subunit A